jgi:hypothetical protein
MSGISEGVVAAIKVGVVDTAKNFFRPWHNARVILGLEHEKSVSEKIEDEQTRIAERRVQAAQSHE